MSRKIDLVKKMHTYSLTAPSSEKGRWQTRFKDSNSNYKIRELLGHTELSTTLGYIYNPLPEKDTYELISKAL